MRTRGLPIGVAAGHPATADAGLEILLDGGSAADATVAAVLASCVAETVMTGLTGGGHAIYWDAASGEASLIDCFVALPGLDGDVGPGSRRSIDIPFGSQTLTYLIGPGTCGVPGVAAGCHELWRRWGRLPWGRLVEPALRLARDGVAMPPAHASCLEMLAPVMTLGDGARIYAPGGRLLQTGERLRQPGLVHALQALADEGAATFYRGSIAEALLALLAERGGTLTAADLAAYTVALGRPSAVRYEGRQLLGRRDLSDLLGTVAALPPLAGLAAPARTRALVAALAGHDRATGTTATTVVDRDGDACVAVTSLGLGTGDWLPGLDLHLNSMLGEVDLIRDDAVPGDRLASNMAPVLAVGGEGLELAAGSAGGTRIRSALVQVLAGVLADGLRPAAAVDRPRLHPLPSLVHVEPGMDQLGLAALVDDGWRVVRWAQRHHYFGGVNVIGLGGAAGDPRRSGAARTL